MQTAEKGGNREKRGEDRRKREERINLEIREVYRRDEIQDKREERGEEL